MHVTIAHERRSSSLLHGPQGIPKLPNSPKDEAKNDVMLLLMEEQRDMQARARVSQEGGTAKVNNLLPVFQDCCLLLLFVHCSSCRRAASSSPQNQPTHHNHRSAAALTLSLLPRSSQQRCLAAAMPTSTTLPSNMPRVWRPPQLTLWLQQPTFGPASSYQWQQRRCCAVRALPRRQLPRHPAAAAAAPVTCSSCWSRCCETLHVLLQSMATTMTTQ